MQNARRSPRRQAIARRIAIQRTTEARRTSPAADIVRIHVLGGFDPFSPFERAVNEFVDVDRSSVRIEGSKLSFGDRIIDLDDGDSPIEGIEPVETSPLSGTALDEGRALFDRNVMRLEETSRMFGTQGLGIGQDAERPMIESVADGSILNTSEDVVLYGEDGATPLFAWSDVAKVTGTEGSAEEGLHRYVPLRVFLVDGSVIEIHGRVAWECFG
jgi:hypothetical protein